MKIRVKSNFAVGATCEFMEKFAHGHVVIMELDEGTKVEDLLLRFSSIGSPGEWDDMLLHVFVNGVLRGMDYILQEDDEINLHIPASGG